MFGHFRKEGRSISVAGPSNLWGVFMETTHPNSQAGIAMATEQAGLEGEERKMATDSTGCSREIDQRARHRLTRSRSEWADHSTFVGRHRWSVCPRGGFSKKVSRRGKFSQDRFAKETCLL